jgi:ATP-binding cassette subfamily B (MDR/TAP) protein 1
MPFISLTLLRTAGQMGAFMPNTAKAKIAAESVFNLIDRTSRIDYSTGLGQKPDRVTVEGRVNVENAVFYYPTRPDTRVLNELNVVAAPSKMIAFVGPSGCGKSTVISLLERWYDLNSGSVKLDGLEIREWEICHLRDQLALVGQGEQ